MENTGCVNGFIVLTFTLPLFIHRWRVV